jgi:hypothetical protein
MSDDLFTRLAAPFRPDQVSWRVGVSNKKKRQRETGDNNAKATKGQVLAYIDARDVMDRLDEVCGPDNWQDRYPHVDKKTVCEIDIWVEGRGWVTKADGAGDSDIEAEKGALSDAFKRAAVRWGIGRYLYHLPTPWVDLDEREQISAADRKKLEGLLVKDAAQNVPASTTKADAPKQDEKRLAPATTTATLSLSQRADTLESAMRSCKTADDLRKAYAKGSKLCGELDLGDPERLAEIEGLYKTLFERLTEKAEGFGLGADNVPEFA